MRNKLLLLVCLGLCILLMSSCSNGANTSNQQFQVITQATQQNIYSNPTAAPAADNSFVADDSLSDYDPAAEEDLGDNAEDISAYTPEVLPEQATTVPTVNSEYAGASPVVIDPIDKPTPTPLPALAFTYQVYDATKLHVSFEGPVGWTVDDTQTDTITLTQPDYEAAGYAASMVVRATSVNSQFNEAELKTEVVGMLNTIGDNGLSNYSKSYTAPRTLMGKTGVYANYTAELADGTEIAGRVHATCINKVLYTVHVSYPRGYTSTYIDTVYAQFRKTLKITQ